MSIPSRAFLMSSSLRVSNWLEIVSKSIVISVISSGESVSTWIRDWVTTSSGGSSSTELIVTFPSGEMVAWISRLCVAVSGSDTLLSILVISVLSMLSSKSL